MQYLMRLWSDQEGQNLPEFALLLFLVCLTAVSAMGGVAHKVNNMYSDVSTQVATAGSPALSGGSASFSAGAPNLTQAESKDVKKQNPTD